MKLRIKGNSVRYRLTKSEVDALKLGNTISDTTSFIDSTLTYSLAPTAAGKELTASYTDNKITVHIPEAWAKEWADTEQVGYENRMQLGNGQNLFILIEKDFKCLDETHEDQSDNFDNPLIAKRS
jgi:hypothetical protein